MSLLQNSNAISEGGYNIANSLRFQSASSQYLSRTPASASNRTTQTFSFWVKMGDIATTDKRLFSCDGAANDFAIIITANKLFIYNNIASVTNTNLTTTQVFRDPSAWYHVVVVYDTTNVTSTERVKLYVNGTQVTAFSTATYPAQNTNTYWNTTNAHSIGRYNTGASQYFDGYMTEVNFIDGQALTPSSFGETNTLTGQWVAKKYTGTYGTNGFYLPFSNGTSTTTLGYDSSGNSNNWTLNNFTRSAGTTDCWVNDVPSGNGSQAGGTQPNSNYPVFNPIDGQSIGLQLSNLYSTPSQSRYTKSTLAIPSSGKWYAEFTINSTAQNLIGISAMLASNANNLGYDSKQICYQWNGAIQREGSSVGTGASITTNDVLALAVNADTQEISFYKNGTVTGVTVSYSSFGTEMFFAFGTYFAGAAAHANFGQRSFAYTPPSGFKALCTANLPAATIKKGNTVFDATTYTGNGTTNRAVVNSGAMQPDFVWVKDRSNTANHILVDAVRGITSVLYSNSTLAQQTGTAIASLNSNGFSVNEPNTGADSSNINARAYVGWQWNAGGSTVTNTNGTISSQVRANPTAGVSVVTWTGAGSAATVGHGLGVAPKMFITKRRDTSENWNVYHTSIGNTGGLSLNITNGTITNIGYWNNTSPTANTLSIGTYQMTNGATYVGYVFAEIAGFSKFGSYVGNGSADGTFVYTGFRPKFVMTKRTDTTSDWVMVDNQRAGYVGNPEKNRLYANGSAAEDSADTPFDFLSNGFKNRTTNTTTNASGGTYIFMAFAENPFAQSNAF